MTTISLATEATRIREVIDAGECARLYVIGGMHPAFASPTARDRAVKVLAPERAAAFLAGWTSHRPTVAAPYVRHTVLAGVRVEVRCA